MKYACVVCLVFCRLALCQPSRNTTFGNCSQVINGNSGVVNVNCKGLDPAVAGKLMEIANALSQLSRTAKADNKTELMLQRLNEILSTTKALEASLADRKVPTEALAALKTFAGAKVLSLRYSRDDADSRALAQQIRDGLIKAGWEVAEPNGAPNFDLSSQDAHLPGWPPEPPVEEHYLRGGIAIVALNAADAANALSVVLSNSKILNHTSYHNYTSDDPSRVTKGIGLVVCSKQ